MNDPEVMGRQAEQSDALDHAARIGLVAYGAVYLLIGWLAIQLALGDHSEEASPQGALAELAQQPFGKVLVWAVAIGLTLLVVWRVIEAAFGHREEEGATRLRKRLALRRQGDHLCRAGLHGLPGRARVRELRSSSRGPRR